MKLALQTISWGPILDSSDLKSIAEFAQAQDFTGLELAQGVDLLPPAKEVHKILSDHGLQIAGLAGSSLRRRMRYIQGFSCDYLYLDAWDEVAVPEAIDAGFKIGLHPHYGRPIGSMNDAAKYLGPRYPSVGLVIDTAHFYLNGDNFSDTFDKYREYVTSVHLKCWRATPGFASLFDFSKEFCSLGSGDLSRLNREFVTKLLSANFEEWVVIEQDHPDSAQNAETSTVRSMEWLSKVRDHNGN